MSEIRITRNDIMIDGVSLGARCLGYRLESSGASRPRLLIELLAEDLSLEHDDVEVNLSFSQQRAQNSQLLMIRSRLDSSATNRASKEIMVAPTEAAKAILLFKSVR